ncbi:MAG: hypothetical protein IAA97_03985 [Spirochaetes bacterium]|uniref:Uncharacterized protein n=1 Tax=Candidatus Ornithospirochaeta stercoripullorum TaxID=2840899 RepID=A0A9D9DY10_9SPIO|nr:hypothetical protein [Candidatus Ornithospirochaeta stercoripullorum]
MKNIGKMVALYPMPIVAVGAFVENKPNWMLIAHSGITGHDRMLISPAIPHYTNKGLSLGNMISLNIIDKQLLAKAERQDLSAEAKKINQSSQLEYGRLWRSVNHRGKTLD